jgi:hypothetical protein
MELNELLNRTAHRIVADGAQVESLALHAIAAAAMDLNPGAAAALADWNGPEVARLRAFGIVHGVLLRELPTAAQAQLLTQLLGASPATVVATHDAVAAPRRSVASVQRVRASSL